MSKELIHRERRQRKGQKERHNAERYLIEFRRFSRRSEPDKDDEYNMESEDAAKDP